MTWPCPLSAFCSALRCAALRWALSGLRWSQPSGCQRLPALASSIMMTPETVLQSLATLPLLVLVLVHHPPGRPPAQNASLRFANASQPAAPRQLILVFSFSPGCAASVAEPRSRGCALQAQTHPQKNGLRARKHLQQQRGGFPVPRLHSCPRRDLAILPVLFSFVFSCSVPGTPTARSPRTRQPPH